MKEYKDFDEEKLLQDNNLRKSYGFNNVYENKINSMYTDKELYNLANKRVSLKYGFLIHLASYVSVCVFLTFVAGFFASMIVALSWGIGLLIHGIATTFAINKHKYIAKEMQNIENERNRK